MRVDHRIVKLWFVSIAGMIALTALALRGADWPMWGGDPSRNMVSAEKNLPVAADPGKAKAEGQPIDPATTKNVKWAAPLGSASYGNAVVAGGCVFVGCNNASPRDPKYQGDYAILLCLDEQTGKMLWQLACPKLNSGKVNDWEQVGLCSSPTVDGDHVYVVTNRCEVLCLDVHGQADGKNRGPFKDEAQYVAGPGNPPISQGAGDADIVWRYDMRDELGAFPRNQASSSVLVIGDKLFVTTSNGVDWSGKHLPSPDCPALICLDKKEGKLLAVERSGISRRTWVCNWSSPAFGVIAGRPTVVFGGGDGFCYGFDANVETNPRPFVAAGSEAIAGDAPPAVPTLKEFWRFDCNPPERHVKDGKPLKYGSGDGPCDVIATPVVMNDRVYVAIGQEPEQGDGAGAMNCIEPRGATGDISRTGRLWTNAGIGRSVSTAAVADGLVYVAELAGIVHCFDAATGAEIWKHDTEGHIWGAAYVADGKIYVGNENGQLVILTAGKEKKLLGTIDLKDAIYSTPVAANGVLYVGTAANLFAFKVQ
ncbi:MAG TPA: PQQ-binding-like beta-propeller repeat protein [Tepidisphaeraceae bacterium]|jgi:outer membrane protein assembly factor BamB|nr:PQQ-binding-like beta-propeller repeat protein [Tepidisphaeraceae bacterium]